MRTAHTRCVRSRFFGRLAAFLDQSVSGAVKAKAQEGALAMANTVKDNSDTLIIEVEAPTIVFPAHARSRSKAVVTFVTLPKEGRGPMLGSPECWGSHCLARLL